MIQNRRKSRWKLKFHHQALPPEYLRHYKQQERKRIIKQTETNKNNNNNNKINKSENKKTRKECNKNNNNNNDTVKYREVTAVLNMDNVIKREEEEGKEKEKEEKDVERLKKSTTITSVVNCFNDNNNKKSPSPEVLIQSRVSPETIFRTTLSGIPNLNVDVSQNKVFLENLLTNQIEINRVDEKEKKYTTVKNSLTQFNKLKSVKTEERQKSYSIPSSGKIMNYSDLPYMGEITLDGIKPRRGRKPKKADICHLIYKNYGQVFPGAPEKQNVTEMVDETLLKKEIKWRPDINKCHLTSSHNKTKGSFDNGVGASSENVLPTVSGLINHAEVQNRIINSLLEKRLTQGLKIKKNYLAKEDGGDGGEGGIDKDDKINLENEEPLNLCIRDLESLKIKLSRKHGNIYETKHQKETETRFIIKTEIDDDPNPDVIIQTTTDKSDSDIETTDENEEEEEGDDDGDGDGDGEDDEEEDDLAPFNLVTTELRESSDDDTFLSLDDQMSLTKKSEMKTKFEKQNSTEDSSPILLWPGSNFFLPNVSPSLLCNRKIDDVASSSNSIKIDTCSSSSSSLNREQNRKNSKSKVEGHRTQLKRMSSTSNGGNGGSGGGGAGGGNGSKSSNVLTKRKRSAIFIPPVPSESTTNPTTEVSICKFKFTGGAKPSLQEKKMLSVDSGGNFRYYSGTGDKSMRGYEYFPRESLQQCQENTGCSPSGVFLTASALGSGEKIPEEIGHSGFFDPDFPIQVSIPKQSSEQKTKLKIKSKKYGLERRGSDVTTTTTTTATTPPYRTLREHLLAPKCESAEVTMFPEDITRDDGNSSDQSGGEGFDFRNLPQSYFDNFKIHDDTTGSMTSKIDENLNRNKKFRKTRKSLAREKLEQTFKEKGFLIQTQQLESAEGATYCKFRQLRKFTRYLFRSWKDYLPGNVRNLSVDAGVDNRDMILDIPETSVRIDSTDPETDDKLK
ncbi:hypothetical protein Phum_PHUM614880 [Pediculus humanus corporis]|uniref:Uncharacterized protein n=1 Tax=Pediculus humanus subsp. corporis TaxID=121224 RepID=E0W440_PEDHC|nr:uncharacterized protein Phum_PHUM614880 [Pediculus humanus corporis]EEB20396.1 hypothetical protein Phum_PHUM614880 [Pediculus humanus corporis]